MIAIVFGMVLPWLLIALGAWLGYQLVRQNGRILLRLESIEKQLGPRARTKQREAAGPPGGLPVGAAAPDFEFFAAHEYSYFFDSTTGKWSRNTERNPFAPNMYVVTLAATPQGTVAWADKQGGGDGLWRLDGASRSWKALPLTGTLPDKSPDRHGLAYDTKRDRLLFFSGIGANKGDVTAYDFKTGEAQSLQAAGKERAGVESRETIYLPELDMVLLGARTTVDGRGLWLFYDCDKNAWRAVALKGDDPIGKGTITNVFHNSMGLMYDPVRKLVWAVGQNSQVHVLRLDLKTATVVDWKRTP